MRASERVAACGRECKGVSAEIDRIMAKPVMLFYIKTHQAFFSTTRLILDVKNMKYCPLYAQVPLTFSHHFCLYICILWCGKDRWRLLDFHASKSREIRLHAGLTMEILINMKNVKNNQGIGDQFSDQKCWILSCYELCVAIAQKLWPWNVVLYHIWAELMAIQLVNHSRTFGKM